MSIVFMSIEQYEYLKSLVIPKIVKKYESGLVKQEEKIMKDLKDTITDMQSADYREQFIAEYEQTKIRYEKLKNFCNKIEVAEITNTEAPKHDCPLSLLREQQKCMDTYLSILEKRALIEGIDIRGINP